MVEEFRFAEGMDAISLTAVLLMVIIFLKDIRRYVIARSKLAAVRGLASFCSCLIIIMDVALFSSGHLYLLATNVYAANIFLAMSPFSEEDLKLPAVSSVSLLVFLLGISVITLILNGPDIQGVIRQKMLLAMAGCLIVLLVFIAIRWSEYRGRPASDNVRVSNYSRLSYALFLSLLMTALFAFGKDGKSLYIIYMVTTVVLMVCFIAVYAALVKGVAFAGDGLNESAVAGKPEQERSHAVHMDEQRKREDLFARIEKYMEEAKPYLDETFVVEDVAMRMYCNHLYISRTINSCSGRNFRQYTNHYRIMYAIDLMKKDPKIKMTEVAMLSGFHSQPTFNLSFKLFMKQTPSEWKREYFLTRKQL